jgi:hypothetical protein
MDYVIPMEEYPRYQEYKIGQTCSIENCIRPADYEVILYDFYSSINETFYEQDHTCPFICSEHMNENELRARGERLPRKSCIYPYTNQAGAQGYTKYAPIKSVYPKFYTSEEIENNKIIQADLNDINEGLISYLAKHPEYLREVNPRKFEELIAEIFRNNGYSVTLTPKTRDGGKDIIALYKTGIGEQLYIVECKRYQLESKVGVEVVRGLYGVQMAENYNQAILVTTSTFTKPAIDFVKPLRLKMQLSDYKDVIEWCKRYKP